MAFAPLIAMAASALISGYGAVKQGQAQSQAANYNSQLSAENAKVAAANAGIASQSGSEQAAQQSESTRAQLGAERVNEAVGGISNNSGSAVDTQVSTRELGHLDALTVRSNAAKEAYGYETQGANFQNQSLLDKTEAGEDLSAGYLSGAGSLLGGLSGAASKWQAYQLNGGLGNASNPLGLDMTPPNLGGYG